MGGVEGGASDGVEHGAPCSRGGEREEPPLLSLVWIEDAWETVDPRCRR